MSLSAHLVVLNYNGRDLLERFMPSWVRSAQNGSIPCRVTILDNASTDGSGSFVRSRYPGVAWVKAPSNKVLCSYNDFARRATEDILIFLNNDIGTDPGFIDPLTAIFKKYDDAFFAASHGDRAVARFRWGVLDGDIRYCGYERNLGKPGHTLTAGIGAFDRKKFLELGGYDELYLPGRYEDVDLCYRGWKRGWKGYYVPASSKTHIGGASFDKAFDARTTQAMVFRNSVLFMVKNITDPFLLSRFLAFLPLRLAAAGAPVPATDLGVSL